MELSCVGSDICLSHCDYRCKGNLSILKINYVNARQVIWISVLNINWSGIIDRPVFKSQICLRVSINVKHWVPICIKCRSFLIRSKHINEPVRLGVRKATLISWEMASNYQVEITCKWHIDVDSISKVRIGESCPTYLPNLHVKGFNESSDNNIEIEFHKQNLCVGPNHGFNQVEHASRSALSHWECLDVTYAQSSDTWLNYLCVSK